MCHQPSYRKESLRGINSSMLLESSCSEVENQKDEIHLPRENFHFLRSGGSSQGLTVVRPMASARQSDQGWTLKIEGNELSLKVKKLSLRDSLLQSSSRIYFLCFFAAQCLKGNLKFNAGDRDKPILNITLVRVSILDTNF